MRLLRDKTKVFWIFLGAVGLTVCLLIFFIQSQYFAGVFQQALHRYMPVDLGIEGRFSELEVKFIPPGVVIKNPVITLKEKNPAGLPAGTAFDAQYIDITFQFFQMLTGAITINAFAVHGATLKLDLDDRFFAAREKSESAKKNANVVSKFLARALGDSLVRFNFRSVSLIDSQLDINVGRRGNAPPFHLKGFARELTVGRSTIDHLPTYDVALDFQKAHFETASFHHSLSQLQASLALSTQGVNLRNFGAQEGESSLHASGHIKGNFLNPKSLKSDLSYNLRGPLEDWKSLGLFKQLPKAHGEPMLKGLLTLEGHLRADLLDFKNSLETEAAVGVEDLEFADWKIDRGSLKGSWKQPVARIDSATLQLGDGTVKIAGAAYDTAQVDQKLHLQLDFEKADFRRLLGPELKSVYPLHMFLSGKAEADIALGPSFSIEGQTELTVRDLSFDNQKPGNDLKLAKKKPLKVLFSIPEVALKSKFSMDGKEFSFERAEVRLPRSKLHAFGTVDPKNGFDIDVSGDITLEDIKKISAFEIGGRGKLHWTIKGRKPDVVFTFDADANDARYLNLNLGHARGRIVYNDGNDTLYFKNLASKQGRSDFIANGEIHLDDSDALSMKIAVPQGTIQDFAAVFGNFLEKSVPWYPKELTGQMKGLIQVSGKTPLNELSIEGDMKAENIDYQHEIFRGGTLHAGYRRGAYIAENINIQKKTGWLRGYFRYGADDAIQYSLKSSEFSTIDIDHLGNFGIPYSAPLAIESQASGKLGSLKGTLRLALGAGSIKTYSIAPSKLELSTENGRLKGQASLFGAQGSAKIDLGWDPKSISSLDLEAERLQFQPMLIALNPSLLDDPELNSEISGAAHLKFALNALSQLSGEVRLGSYSLKKRNYGLSLAHPLKIAIHGGNYNFGGLNLVGEGTALHTKGKVQDGSIDYEIEGPLHLGIFSFLTPEIASVDGSAQINAKLTGRAESPSFRALVTAKGADVRLNNIEQPFEDLNFKVICEDSTLQIPDFTAKFAGGSIKGSGAVQLRLTSAPRLDLKAALDNTKIKVYPVAYARMSGQMALQGDELPYKATGSLKVAEALIKENFNLNENSRILRSAKFLPQKQRNGANEFQLFDLNINLTADRNIFLRNDLFDAELRGNLKVINSVQTPRLLGDVGVLHGKVLFKDNYFIVQNGTVRFNNPAALDPEFELTGQSEIKGYKIILVANGTVSNYQLNFQSQPPLSQNDIVSLLALGVTSSEYQGIARENREAYSRDEMYALVFSQSEINKGLQEKLGVKVRVNQSQSIVPENAFRAKGNSELTETVSPKVVVQKEVVKNLNASFGKTVGVGDNQETDADLEYKLPIKNFSIRGVYEDQRAPQARQSRNSVGGDLKWQLRFK